MPDRRSWLERVFWPSERRGGAAGESDWPVPSLAEAVALGGLFLWLWVQMLADGGWILWFVRHANLLIHEAGHGVFGPFGWVIAALGGTLLQCLVPLGCDVLFWKTRQSGGVAAAGVWLGENWTEIAIYMADAQVQVLPRVGGGLHDWYHLFNWMGVLHHCRAIAAVVAGAGWLLMLGSAGGYGWFWWRSRRPAPPRPPTSPIPAERGTVPPPAMDDGFRIPDNWFIGLRAVTKRILPTIHI